MSRGYFQCTDPAKLPRDTVSCAQWSSSRDPALFMVTSWDGTFRVYQVAGESFAQIYILERDMPLTAFATNASNSKVLLGYLNGTVTALNPQTGLETPVTEHACPLRRIFFLEPEGLVVTFDVGSKMKVVDAESGQSFELNFEHRISCVDFKRPLFAVGFGAEKYALFNLNDVQAQRVTYANNPLNSPLSCIQLHDQNSELLLGTYDGRVARISLQSYTKPPPQTLFKAHSVAVPQHETLTLHQVNALAFCNRGGVHCCLTAGGEGKLVTWEYMVRERYREHAFALPVVDVCVQPELGLVLVCLGYDWSAGAIGMERVNYQPQLLVYALHSDDFKKP